MSKKKIVAVSRSLIIRSVDLSPEKRALIALETPKEFIKERPGKGGKTFRYIEGGYVIARLNQVFSPIGWDFQIVDERIDEKEVIIRGRLEIKDFKTGFSIGKTRTGSKERVAGVTLGDTIKAAETDSLKKCASHFGIGLDVYWQQLDLGKVEVEDKPKSPVVPSKNSSIPQTKAQLMVFSIEKISSETDPTILNQYRDRISKSTIYNDNQKKMLFGAIDGKLKEYAKNQIQ